MPLIRWEGETQCGGPKCTAKVTAASVNGHIRACGCVRGWRTRAHTAALAALEGIARDSGCRIAHEPPVEHFHPWKAGGKEAFEAAGKRRQHPRPDAGEASAGGRKHSADIAITSVDVDARGPPHLTNALIDVTIVSPHAIADSPGEAASKAEAKKVVF